MPKHGRTQIMGLWRREGAKVDADTPLVVGEKEIGALADACVALARAKAEARADLRNLIDSARAWARHRPRHKRPSRACGL